MTAAAATIARVLRFGKASNRSNDPWAFSLVVRSEGVYAAAMGDERIEPVLQVRRATAELVAPLEPEDMVAQSMPDASPAKWHLAHTTWFFERFVLRTLGVPAVNDAYDYLFNSYYESVGPRHARAARGLLTRPTVSEVMDYRRAVDSRLADLAGSPRVGEVAAALDLGAHHEQQHQELLLTDVMHLFSMNPLRPAYRRVAHSRTLPRALAWNAIDGGVAEIGHDGDAFSFDNERPRHRVYVAPFSIASRLVTCGEYDAFIADGGYRRPELWLSDGFAWAKDHSAPLYWLDGGACFTLGGERARDPNEPVTHITYYEADAYARWAGARLATEAEWEIGRNAMCDAHGVAWQWTSSAYAPYPGFRPLEGAFGEYNGKFMVNQMVLRGSSCFTPKGHARDTYRNFFPPSAAWQATGIRLARDA
jgi:ergothioneine biosynthesis protein EgtB